MKLEILERKELRMNVIEKELEEIIHTMGGKEKKWNSIYEIWIWKAIKLFKRFLICYLGKNIEFSAWKIMKNMLK